MSEEKDDGAGGAHAGGAGRAGPRVVRLDHVQLAMPPGLEAQAEAFYVGILGMAVLEKPPVLAARGGRWFGSASGVQVHLGVEQDFRPAEKAHPALGVAGLDDLVGSLVGAGYPIRWDDELPGVRRCYVADPFGNRIELVED